MKLATLKDTTRDGKLVVVSKDLTRCSEVGHIARSLQAALDDWDHVGPRLLRVADGIENGSQPTMRFHEHGAASPLPRAFQRVDGSAYQGEPLTSQAGSDSFIGPRDPIIVFGDGIEVAGKVAVIIDDVQMNANLDEARDAIRLLLLVADVNLASDGHGLFQSKPSSAFSPVAVTPDELGSDWSQSRLNLTLNVDVNSKPFSRLNVGSDMIFDFSQLIAHAAKTRRLEAGTIISSDPDGPATTTLLSFGDIVRIEMKDKAGHSIFGAIEQSVTRYGRE